jgi:trk system potassium uptake protein TrkA
MFILLVGGGKIGYHLIRALIAQRHEVALIESDPRTSQAVAKTFDEVQVIAGDGTNPKVLRRAGIEHADAVVALAGRDQDNFVICKTAKQLFGVKRTLARVNDPRNERLFKLAGVDLVMSVTAMVAQAIKNELVPHEATTLFTWHERMAVVEVDLPPNAPVIGQPFRKLDLPENTVLAAIWRNDGMLVPTANTVLEAGDELFAIAPQGQEASLRVTFLGEEPT